MADKNQPKMTPQTFAVLRVLIESEDELSGAEIGKRTKLASGSLYPILIRLEKARWLTSEWEKGDPAELGRPLRRYYSVTGGGRSRARSYVREQTQAFGSLAWTS